MARMEKSPGAVARTVYFILLPGTVASLQFKSQQFSMIQLIPVGAAPVSAILSRPMSRTGRAGQDRRASSSRSAARNEKFIRGIAGAEGRVRVKQGPGPDSVPGPAASRYPCGNSNFKQSGAFPLCPQRDVCNCYARLSVTGLLLRR